MIIGRPLAAKKHSFEATIRLADTETAMARRSFASCLSFEATIRLADTETSS